MSLTWHPPGQKVQFGEFHLKGGMFYSSSKPLQWPGEPSAIIATASVGRHADAPTNDLGYYPSYWNLADSQRRTYLEWLACGRRDEKPEARALGYLFLFFYGIEWRIIMEKDRDPALIEELMGLLRHYSHHHKSRSLRSYFLSLAHYGSRLMGAEAYRHYWAQLMELDEGKTGAEVMKLILANLFEVEEPLHWSVAYRMAMADPSCRKSVVIDRTKQEFWTLFQARFENEFPGGMPLKSAKQNAVFNYRPASYALLSKIDYGRQSPYDLKIANVAGQHSQFQAISSIWNSCVEDLSGYSRAVSSKKTDVAGLKTWLALPDELKKSTPSPMQPFWEWMQANAPRQDEFHFVTVGAMAAWYGIAERKKLTKGQAIDLVYGAAAMGWNIAPHPDHVDQTFAWDQEVTVYKRISDDPPEPQIPGLVRLLYLLMPVAAADGSVDQSEIDAFHRLMGHEVSKENDWQYLEAVLLALLRDTNLASQSLLAMTKHIAKRNRESVFRLLIHIAAADGEVAPEEFKVLQKIARALELEPDLAERILRDDVAFREVTVTEAKPSGRAGEKIPPKAPSQAPGLALNMDRIAALTKETHEVVSMLASVMAEEEEPQSAPEPVAIAKPTGVSVPAWAVGIALPYQAALVYLAEYDELTAGDFESLAQWHHLMPDDLLNSINAWADEALGDFLIERGDPIRIYRDLIS